MDYQDDTPAAGGGLWSYPDNVVAGEADADDVNRLPTGMFNYSNDDLFDMVWQQGGGGGVSEQAVVSSNLRRSPPPFTASALVHDPEVLPNAPSEEEMALWLSPIVRGEEEQHARYGEGISSWSTPPDAPSEEEMALWLSPIVRGEEERASYGDGGNGMILAEGMATKDTANDSGQKEAARGARTSHHGEIHNLTEKKRRCKINDRLKTLQQLVPGCDKSNHASTLEQTIRYMKWLQHQVQAMSVVGPAPPVRPPPAATATTAAVYPVVQPPPAGVAPVVLGPLPVVLFRPLLPFAHYPSPAMLAPAAASPLYPAPAPPDPARTAPATGSGAANHRHGSRAARSRGAEAAAACDTRRRKLT